MPAYFNWTRYWAPYNKPVQNYDFLPDPETVWGDKDIVPFDKIQHIPCLIMVGNPGVGKSIAIEHITKNLNAQNIPSVLKDFREYSSFNDLKDDLLKDEAFRVWQDSQQHLHLFLDGLDEGRLLMQRLEHDLRRFLATVPCERLLLRITCRAAELPGDLPDLLKPLWTINAEHSNDQHLVQIYQLAQLREYDVWQFAAQDANERGLDANTANTFLEEVIRAGVASFAAYPITLNVLLRIYRRDGTLPTERKAIYAEGCRFLAQENSRSRVDDGFVGEFEVDERLKAARQVAAVSIIGNRPSIFTTAGAVSDNGELRLDECYLPEQNWQRPIALLEETLQTGLFRTLDYRHHVWAHLSYGEFLAAEFFANGQMPLKQIKNLLINPSDPDGKITPKLHETAAWLASMRDEVFNWIFQVEPIILIKSNSVQLTTAQKAALINKFIQLYATNGIIEERLDWNDLKRLDYPELGDQLRSYIQNKALPLRARELCVDFIIDCKVATTDDLLIGLALDADENPYLRKATLRALEHPKRQSDEIQALRSLVFQGQAYNTDVDMVSLALDILWPQHLTPIELFDHLHLPGQDEFMIGSPYDRLFRGEIADQLDADGLLIALGWVVLQGNRHDHEVSLSGLDFIMSIMRRAWNHLDDEQMRLAFARTAWSRLTQFNPVIAGEERFWRSDQPEHNYADELRQNTLKRHNLLQSMLDVLAPEGLANNELQRLLLFPLNSRDLPFATPEDIPWLIERAREDVSEERRQAYAYLAFLIATRQVPYEDTASWSFIYNEYESGRNLAITSYFRERFGAWEINSERAENGRKLLAQQREFEERRLALEAKKMPVEKHVREWLAACEEDSSKWWGLSHSLLSNEFGNFFWGQWDLRKGYGWQTIQDDTDAIVKVVLAAHRYIKEQHPYIGNYESSLPLMNRAPALEGYRALILLARLPLLDDTGNQDWQRWSNVVVFNTVHKDQEIAELDDLLLQRAWEHGAEAAFDQLRQILERDQEEDKTGYHLDGVLHRCKYAPNNELAKLLISNLELLSPQDERFNVILRHLLRMNVSASKDIEKIAVSHLDGLQGDDQRQQVCKQIISTLGDYARNGDWWPAAWALMSSDKSFAKTVFDAIADWHSSPYLRYLKETQLHDLYLLAVEVYPYTQDIEFHGGAVPEPYIKQEWRNGILNELVGRGTAESLGFLTTLYEQMPETPNISYLLTQAKVRFRLESWVAPKPAIILTLAHDSQRRYIRNGDQWLELIMDTLSDIQEEYRGSAVMKNGLWHRQADDNTVRPGIEDELSDAIAEWLRDRLRRTVVNREPQVGFIPQSHERTDIQVETFSDTDEPLMVILEVKGCWYRDIFERMQSQLVDQYLANHDRCGHGLYLVGYFASDRWDIADTRRETCGRRNKEVWKQELEATAKALTMPKPITVETFVFDASL